MQEEYKKIADLLFPNIASGAEYDRAYFENMYINEEILKVQRPKDNGQEYLRLAPSPTGELHAGALYLATISDTVAHNHNNGGKLIIRIEDTDKVREVEGAKERMVKYLSHFNIKIDEGLILDEKNNLKEVGDFGPYVQSERTHIYNAFLYDFLLKGFAYPCFMSSDELEKMREEQTVMKVRPGVYGKYAKSKDMTYDEVKNKIGYKDENGESQKYVIRLNSSGDFAKKITFVDEIMGKLELSENDEHFVIAKGDGVPTYHFAHLIDDYTMGITFVIRANEWVASITKHIELWNKLGVSPIKYGHIMPINKTEVKILEDRSTKNAVRKLSKRKDPEASVAYYIEKGYPVDAVKSYLLRLANPSFDAWWDAEVVAAAKENREINYIKYVEGDHFNFDELKRNSRGPLLDFDKLNNISADVIGSMSAYEVSRRLLDWSEMYDKDFYNILNKYNQKENTESKSYLEQIMSVERGGEHPRKDIYNFSVAKESIFYFFDELYEKENENNFTSTEKEILSIFANKIESIGWGVCMNSLEVWMEKMKTIYAEIISENESNEEIKNQKFGAIMMLLRKAITKREKTPNLYFIFQVLGKNTVIKRLNNNS